MGERVLSEARVGSPLGELVVLADAAGLRHVAVARDAERLRRLAGPHRSRPGDPHGAAAALAAYFAGDVRALERLPVAPAGTPGQQRVWRALREIPPGATESYGSLAARLGRPRAARAVGAANGRNPLAIVIPCHRLVGARGALTGYAAGLDAKAWLLAHERTAVTSGRRGAP